MTKVNLLLHPSFENQYASSPVVLVDVGAAGGISSRWLRIRKYLQVIGFEPNTPSFDKLASATEKYHDLYLHTALYSEQSSRDFYILKRQNKSSLLQPNSELLDKYSRPERAQVVETKQIQVDTLDRQLETIKVSDVDFIKIDIQGAEYYALQGAKKILASSVCGLEVEVSFGERYTGQPLFSEIELLLRGVGFELIDLRTFYWKRKIGEHLGGPKGQLMVANALFFRSPERLLADSVLYGTREAQRAKILRTITVALVYGCADFAAGIFDFHKNYFSKDETDTILNSLENWKESKQTIQSKARRKLSDVFFALYKALESPFGGKLRKTSPLGNPLP